MTYTSDRPPQLPGRTAHDLTVTRIERPVPSVAAITLHGNSLATFTPPNPAGHIKIAFGSGRRRAGWGELHPWVDRDGFWDGVAMVFTPEKLDDVDIVIRLLVESYNYVTELDLDPTDY